ncbi:sensor histidine kinase [Deinococcus budaensis]|uniref:histidine kinase n=1 Tax=Deinococcus budaensis TaxID=1665626 RepID=A0A7W8GDM3_9DEIO|nr:ATP-binding protein [Deinococcus budaensis]MBB5233672.1 signal transduction histidine kinase [Deinococcus budaensis]
MTPLRRAALLLWLLAALLAGLFWSLSAVRGVRAEFETGARILHRVLSQRSEPQEAVLVSLGALARAGVGEGALAQYAAALRAQYPQIVGVQRCRGRCLDLGPSGLTLPAARLTPDPAGLRWHPGAPTVYALARGEMRVWVDARRLLRPGDLPDPAAAFQVRRPGAGTVLLDTARLEPQPPLGAADRLLPVLGVRKVLGSAAQPFVFEGRRPLHWAELPLAGLAVFAALSGLAAALLVRLIEGREGARQAAREAERALQAERARAERAFHAVSEALIVTDAAGRVQLTNPAARALLGAGAEGGALEGRDVREVVRFQATLGQRPFDAPGFWRSPALAELPEGVTLLTPAGARLVEGALAPVLAPGHGGEAAQEGQAAQDEGRGPAGWVLVLRDVGPLRARVVAALEDGERRVREHAEMLAHATRLATLGEMGAGLAHELNQPLTAIVSHGQAALRLLEDPAQTGRARRSLEAVVTQARRAADIITHLRGFVQRAPTRAREVDVNQAAENALTLARPDLTRLGVRLETRLHPGPLRVQADPVHLEQVLLNLLRNAGDALAGAERPEIEVATARHGAEVRVTVRDHGEGLDAEVLSRLFTPFTTTKAGGLGLGLSLSQTLVQGMEGRLDGENHPAGGALFTVTLPLAVPQAREPAVAAARG